MGTQMEPFEPAHFNFVLLRSFRIPGGVAVYEYKNHPAIDGAHDFLRLNLYLSKDGTFVMIWHGLLEPIGAEAELREGRLASAQIPANLDFHASYNLDLFRGHIDSADAAVYIFKALRIGAEGTRYARPQVLHAGTDNSLHCDVMSN